ncbi:hypothetical protein F5Y00DRAFT_264115 [Daldinia vernicosa]|uniref:uncharacterized protein n=1 Tax=Daldinia vernicosa TaxID=114800 RepID=UPI0020084111|nr:uncharacterized protein F5Y00DRAFT_264115 [Daldinia vernicosa]KAI0846902.1 hypothetical protein F5Y00DRAFT_264115 [Daldinia vernicosa]
MSPVPRTPSPEPQCSSSSSDELSPPTPDTNPRRGLNPAIAHGIGNEGDVKLTSFSGHDLLQKHYQMPQMPALPSPFDSPTSDRMSSSASKDPLEQRNIMGSVRMTEYRPDYLLSAWGTPSRSSSKREGRANQSYSGGTFVGSEYEPRRIWPFEKDPVRRFLAAELHRMAGRPPSKKTLTNTRPPKTPHTPNKTPKSRKRGIATVENQDKDLDGIGEDGDEDLVDTKLVPGMAEFELSRRSPTPTGQPSKRAKHSKAGSDNEGITDCPQTSH